MRTDLGQYPMDRELCITLAPKAFTGVGEKERVSNPDLPVTMRLIRPIED